MAGAPKFKVYRGREYIAACKYAEDAAALVAITTDGTVKYDHTLTIWREGHEEFEAGESYDRAAEIMASRVQKHHEASYVSAYGALPD